MASRYNKRFRREDYEWGVEQENKVFPIIQSFFGGNVVRAKNAKSRFDCSDTNSIYEIKSRRCNLSRYPTTVITKDKAVNIGKRIFFIFNFYDRVAYIEYDPEKFRHYKDYQLSDYYDNPNWEIPIEDLTVFHRWNSGCLL